MAKTPRKPKAPKAPSMKRVAKLYKKNHTPSKMEWSGARVFDNNAQDSGAGTFTPGRNTYKPKAKKLTLGGTRKGKGTTITRKGRA